MAPRAGHLNPAAHGHDLHVHAAGAADDSIASQAVTFVAVTSRLAADAAVAAILEADAPRATFPRVKPPRRALCLLTSDRHTLGQASIRGSQAAPQCPIPGRIGRSGHHAENGHTPAPPHHLPVP